jgi:hypothetical protein
MKMLLSNAFCLSQKVDQVLVHSGNFGEENIRSCDLFLKCYTENGTVCNSASNLKYWLWGNQIPELSPVS